MSALESPHLLLPLEKPTDRRAANPAVAQAVQAESAGEGRAAATRLPAKDPLGPQRPRQVPPTEGTSSAAGRCGLQACRAESPFPLLKATPCVVFVMAPVPAPPNSSPQLAHHQALFHGSFLIRPFYHSHHRLEHRRLSHPELATPVDQPLRIHRPQGLEGTLSSRPMRWLFSLFLQQPQGLEARHTPVQLILSLDRSDSGSS